MSYFRAHTNRFNMFHKLDSTQKLHRSRFRLHRTKSVILAVENPVAQRQCRLSRESGLKRFERRARNFFQKNTNRSRFPFTGIVDTPCSALVSSNVFCRSIRGKPSHRKRRRLSVNLIHIPVNWGVFGFCSMAQLRLNSIVGHQVIEFRKRFGHLLASFAEIRMGVTQ